MPIAKLITFATADAMPALAITDTNNLFGALEFSEKAAKAGLQPIVGIQLSLGFGASVTRDVLRRQARRTTPSPSIIAGALMTVCPTINRCVCVMQCLFSSRSFAVQYDHARTARRCYPRQGRQLCTPLCAAIVQFAKLDLSCLNRRPMYARPGFPAPCGEYMRAPTDSQLPSLRRPGQPSMGGLASG